MVININDLLTFKAAISNFFGFLFTLIQNSTLIVILF